VLGPVSPRVELPQGIEQPQILMIADAFRYRTTQRHYTEPSRSSGRKRLDGVADLEGSSGTV
jgi:hypothetical protein